MKTCVSHQGPRRIAPASLWASSAQSVVCLGTATLWACRRSCCASPMRVFCTSSSLRISRALRMCALMYRTWTTPLSVIAATRSCGQATWAQPDTRRALYSFSCQPDGVVSGTQPVCDFLPRSAPNVDSEYGVDVLFCSADERSCVVSCASGSSIVEDPAVWTFTTNDSWTDCGLLMCEPQVCATLSFGRSVASDCDGRTVSCASGFVASDMDDAVFKCLAPAGTPDGTLPSCVLLVGCATGYKLASGDSL